jgi:CubicO group peptidase (beta-lactamase class C family)
LGVYVVTSSDERASPWAIGEFGWSGAASLISWVNPRLDISVVFATQLFPSDTFPLYPELNALVYGALHSA